MRATWKGQRIGDLDLTVGLTVKEMQLVRRELPEFKNPLRFLAAAIDLAQSTVVRGPDGRPSKDDAGALVTKAEPNDEWDPCAFALLVSILHARAGVDLLWEDVDGVISDLQLEQSPEEQAQIKAALEKAGKAATPETTGTEGSGPTPPSPSGSGDTPPVSGSTTA